MYDEKALDIICEIINIGIGEAANSLSNLVNTRVIIRIPEIQILHVSEVNEYIQKEVPSIGVYISQNFKDLVKGKTILFYTRECCVSLLNAIYGQTAKTSSLTESGIATLNEIGNIIMVSCMAEISNMIEGKIFFDLPQVTVEISEKYFQNLIRELGESGKAIVVKNEIRIKDTDIKGYLFILMSFEDLNAVVEILIKKMKHPEQYHVESDKQ
ncbi:MAG: hypothetical protein BWK80_09110 [Desulfobacteraceae bacterium IS3]|nr:MAG: hypothetical protein BWK80_09110 [Desulfobacteraceae bacterium IS3]